MVSGKTRLKIEVVYALRDDQVLIAVEVEEGSTVRQAIERSGILLQFPDITLARIKVGVFGQVVPVDTTLKDGDRVEIYRPLIADPKEARRARAKRTKPPARRR